MKPNRQFYKTIGGIRYLVEKCTKKNVFVGDYVIAGSISKPIRVCGYDNIKNEFENLEIIKKPNCAFIEIYIQENVLYYDVDSKKVTQGNIKNKRYVLRFWPSNSLRDYSECYKVVGMPRKLLIEKK